MATIVIIVEDNNSRKLVEELKARPGVSTVEVNLSQRFREAVEWEEKTRGWLAFKSSDDPEYIRAYPLYTEARKEVERLKALVKACNL